MKIIKTTSKNISDIISGSCFGSVAMTYKEWGNEHITFEEFKYAMRYIRGDYEDMVEEFSDYGYITEDERADLLGYIWRITETY